MKKILMLIASLGVIPLITSCADYGVYGYQTTVSRPLVATNTTFVGGGLAPMQVGFVATTFDRWAWDPFRRHYFDRSCGRFFDPRLRRYCTVVPRRFHTAVYPSGYRRGGPLACPSFLPRTRFAGGHRGHDGHVGVPSRGGRFAPVVHGSSRGAVQLRDAGRSGRAVGRGSNGRAGQTGSPIRRSVSPPVRRSVNPATISQRSRLETVSTTPSRSRIESRPSSPVSQRSIIRGSSSDSRASAPVVQRRPTTTAPSRATSQSRPVTRSRQVTRSRPTRAVPSSAAPSRGSSRTTSNTSRAISRTRQRTR